MQVSDIHAEGMSSGCGESVMGFKYPRLGVDALDKSYDGLGSSLKETADEDISDGDGDDDAAFLTRI